MGVVVGADDHIVMKMHAALGNAGRAGRVQPECRVVLCGRLGFELRRDRVHQIAQPTTLTDLVADENDFTEIGELLAWNRLELGKQTFVDERYAGSAIIEDVFVFMRFGLSVHGDSHAANFDGSEKRVEEFGRIEKQQENALSRADAKTPQGIAGAIGALKKLLICDALIATFDGDVLRSAFKDVAINEICGDVENVRQGDHVVAIFVAR